MVITRKKSLGAVEKTEEPTMLLEIPEPSEGDVVYTKDGRLTIDGVTYSSINGKSATFVSVNERPGACYNWRILFLNHQIYANKEKAF